MERVACVYAGVSAPMCVLRRMMMKVSGDDGMSFPPQPMSGCSGPCRDRAKAEGGQGREREAAQREGG